MTPCRSVLVAEDDEDVRENLKFALECEGYKVFTVVHGKEALEFLTAGPEKPSVILLDLMMPIMDGQTLVSTLERDYPELARTIPIIVVSAAGDGVRSSIQASESLRKPVDLDILLAAIERCCGKPT